MHDTSAQTGRGECRVPMHPQPRVRNKKAHELVTTSPPEQPGIPARNGFNGLLRALPGDRAFLSPSPCEWVALSAPGWADRPFARLDAGVEASGPHDFTVRSNHP